jgi:hypothetical protein
MAINENTYSSNAVQGEPIVGADFNIFDTHSTPRYAVGTRIKRQDGNEFVYSHFGANTDRGLLVAPDISESGVATVQDNLVKDPATAVVGPDNKRSGTIGSNSVQITLASIAADAYAGGYFITVDDTGEGYTYRIKGNTATNNPITGDIRIDLYEKLQVALTTATDVMIIPCKYANLEAATGGTDHMAVGVTCSNQVTASTAYGWICVKGVVGGLVDGTIALGEAVTLSDGVAGAFQVAGGGSTAVVDLIDERVIGECIVAAGASTEHAAFHVNIS